MHAQLDAQESEPIKSEGRCDHVARTVALNNFSTAERWDSDLQIIVNHWHYLSQPVRAGIIAMIQASIHHDVSQ